jgi:hypothetical protein
MEFLKPKERASARRWSAGALCIAAACLALAACVSPATGTRQYQDESTAVTVTTATEPLVLAREVSLLAANARDYVSLFPVEVNRAGQRRYYFFGYTWSTIDRRTGPATTTSEPISFSLRADDRDIELKASPREFQSAGISEWPVPAPVPTATPFLFPTDRATLLFVSTARVLSAGPAGASSGSPTERYLPWSSPKLGFVSFFERIGPAQALRNDARPR